MICDVPDVERVFLAHRDTNFWRIRSARPQVLINLRTILDPKDYNKPNDTVLIDVEVATCQGDYNW